MGRAADTYTPVELNRFGSAATWIFNSVLFFSGGGGARFVWDV